MNDVGADRHVHGDRNLQTKRTCGNADLGKRRARFVQKLAHGLADAEFLQRIGEYNGTPRELLQDAELMQLYLPLLRDDFAICETYAWRAGAPLACPLTALGGSGDAEVALEDLHAWAGLAGNGYDEHVFDGDHFFIQPHKLRILELLGAIGLRAPRTGLAQAEAG